MKIKPVFLKIYSSLINILVCLSLAYLIVESQNGFGSGDIFAFIIWTIPLSIAYAISGSAILYLFRNFPLPVRIILILIIASLLSFSWVYMTYLILGGYVNAFSFPILYIWIAGSSVQLLFLERFLPKPEEKIKKQKIILTLFAFPITSIVVFVLIVLLSLLSSYLNRPEKETFLIPANFEGKIRIVYGEKCGIELEHENGRRVLNIPDDGILIIQPKFEAGQIDHAYYLVDKTGNRKSINGLWEYNQRIKHSPGVLLAGSGAFGGEMPDGSSSTESPLAIHYTDLIVFNKDTILKNEKEEISIQHRFDSLTNVKVNACRSN